jgi:hypothetical protein
VVEIGWLTEQVNCGQASGLIDHYLSLILQEILEKLLSLLLVGVGRIVSVPCKS